MKFLFTKLFNLSIPSWKKY